MDIKLKQEAISKIKSNGLADGKNLTDEEAEKIFAEINDWLDRNSALIELIQQNPSSTTHEKLTMRKHCENCNGFGITQELKSCAACNGTGIIT